MKYDAFISYRHSELDTYIAKKVHKKLETFRIPKAVKRKSGKNRINRVFRDQEELPIGNDLNHDLENALAESEFLIVICSPRTPDSEWVNKEIATFIQFHDREHVLAVLAEGDPYESFPEILLKDRYGNPIEPLAADVRGDNKRECNKKLKSEIVRLAAPLLYCGYDDLKQRHKERRTRKIMAIISAALLLAISFGVYSTFTALSIKKNYQEKLINQSKVYASYSLDAFEKGDRKTAALIALEALPSSDNDRPFVPEAEYALAKSLNLYAIGNDIMKDSLLKHDLHINGMAEADDGTLAASYDSNSYVYIWDLNKGERIGKILPRYMDDYEIAQIKYIEFVEDKILICDSLGAYLINKSGEVIWKQKKTRTVDAILNNDKTILGLLGMEEVVFINPSNGTVIDKIDVDESEYISSGCTFSEDSKRFAYASTDKIGSEKMNVYVYSLDTKKKVTHVVKGDYAYELLFAEEKIIVNHTNSIKLGGKNYITAFSDKGKVWEKTFEQPDIRYIFECSITYSEYMNQIVWRDNNHINVINPDNGKIIQSTITSDNIEELSCSSKDSSLFILLNNGTLLFTDLEKDISSFSEVLNANTPAEEFMAHKGVVLIRESGASNILVYKFFKDEDATEFAEFDENIYDVLKSQNENNICVKTESKYYFYSLDGKLLAEYDRAKANGDDDGFIDDNRFLMVNEDKLICYNVLTKDEQTIQLEADESWVTRYNLRYSKDGKRICAYSSYEYFLLDADTLKVIAKGTLEAVNNLILDSEGKMAYGSLSDKIISIDLESGKTETIPGTDGIPQVHGSKGSMVLNDEENKLGIICRDGKARVYNLSTNTIEHEIEFYGSVFQFIVFSKDSTKLFLQGDDYLPKVFDLEKNKFVSEFREQHRIMDRVEELDNETYLVANSNTMIVLDKEYNRLCEINYGRQYIKKNNTIILADDKKLYTFKYLDLEGIIKKAKGMFGDETLSDEDRIKYNMD